MKRLATWEIDAGCTYRHLKNPRFVVTVKRRFMTAKGLVLVLEHPWFDEWQICLADCYPTTRWECVK